MRFGPCIIFKAASTKICNTRSAIPEVTHIVSGIKMKRMKHTYKSLPPDVLNSVKPIHIRIIQRRYYLKDGLVGSRRTKMKTTINLSGTSLQKSLSSAAVLIQITAYASALWPLFPFASYWNMAEESMITWHERRVWCDHCLAT